MKELIDVYSNRILVDRGDDGIDAVTELIFVCSESRCSRKRGAFAGAGEGSGERGKDRA